MSEVATASLKDDLLNGATEIADFLGRPKWNERRVYHVADKKYLPIGRIGQQLFARKSELDKALSGDTGAIPSV